MSVQAAQVSADVGASPTIQSCAPLEGRGGDHLVRASAFYLLDIWDSISSNMAIHVSRGVAFFMARAKLVPDGNGGMRVANICSFNRPVFNAGFEPAQFESFPQPVEKSEISSDQKQEHIKRATRRAKEACMDYILCNDLNVFATLTYSPEKNNRSSYNEVCRKLGVWCSNLVQRHDFKYVAVPEYHKDGENIHFHMLSSTSGLKLIDSGHVRKSKPVFNIDNWKWGFSTAQFVTGESARDKCAKYIFKYMGKQMGQKIGGRYYLSGGMLDRPTYIYADDPRDLGDLTAAVYNREIETDGGLYREWSFL